MDIEGMERARWGVGNLFPASAAIYSGVFFAPGTDKAWVTAWLPMGIRAIFNMGHYLRMPPNSPVAGPAPECRSERYFCPCFEEMAQRGASSIKIFLNRT
jgi:hypothetical protein